MEVKGLHHYKQGVEAVFRFFSEADAVKEKYESIGARKVEILETEENDGLFTIKTRREVPADVPGILQKFLGAWNKVVQTEQWRLHPDGVRSCEMRVDIAGVPVTVKGTMRLQSESGGCVNNVSINVTCGIPLIGGRLADFIGGDTKKNMDSEYDYISGNL